MSWVLSHRAANRDHVPARVVCKNLVFAAVLGLVLVKTALRQLFSRVSLLGHADETAILPTGSPQMRRGGVGNRIPGFLLSIPIAFSIHVTLC
jgi:hypothetical protein